MRKGDLIKELDKLSNTDEIQQAIARGCIEIANQAKLNCGDFKYPTGYLRASIKTETRKEGTKIIGSVYTNAYYAPYVEYGTGNEAEAHDGRKDVPWTYRTHDGKWFKTYGQKPKKFFRLAFDTKAREVEAFIDEAIERALNG